MKKLICIAALAALVSCGKGPSFTMVTIAAIPQTTPIIITHPRSTPSMAATKTGPGVGGMKA